MSRELYFASFCAGFGVGALAAWLLCRETYKKKAEDEIRLMEEVKKTRKENREKAEAAINKPEINNYISKLNELGYKQEKEEEDPYGPYIIMPENFGEFSDYEVISLTYFADGVVADDNNDIVDNVEECIGSGFESHYGEYEDDVVYVRNNARSCDYEIQRDLRTFNEAMTDRPPLKWEDG